MTDINNKGEFYSSMVRLHKKCGQGTSGIVRMNVQYNSYMDELIEEGLMTVTHSGGSIGHPESNQWYVPTGVYNVWQDEGTDGEYQKFKGRYLRFVRFFLGILEAEETRTMLSSPEFMQKYAEWLERNKEALDTMINQDEAYPGSTVLSNDVIQWAMEKKWYEENLPIKTCYKQSVEGMNSTDQQIISMTNELIDLYKKSGKPEHIEQITEAEQEILQMQGNRKKIHIWFEMQDQELLIQDAFATLTSA